jgi:hypothetical protein
VRPLALIFFAISAFALTASAQNLVVYNDALENGWVDYSWATVSFANTTPLHSGGDSIKVVDPGSSYEAIYLHHAALTASVYQSLSFWIYPTSAKNNELNVQATLNGVAQTSVYLSFTTAQVNQWQQITIPLSSLGVSSQTNFDGFWIQNNTGGALTWYLDDISLLAISPPNPVALSVNAQSVTRTIDARYYGMNLAIWDSHLSDAATRTFTAGMGSGVFRFPGGSASDDYDWSTDRSVSNNTFQWVNNSATFAGVTTAAGAQAYVTVNYGSGTPQQAAAWVAYYNGSTTNTAALGTDSKGANWKTVSFWAGLRSVGPLATDDGYNFLRAAHPAPYGFHYWEVGNECYGSWENDLHGTSGSGLSGSPQDPYTYAQAFAQYYQAMLAVDPTIHLGVPATTGEDSYGNGTHAVPNPNEGNTLHSGWVPVVLATLQALDVTPHFLIHHVYPENPGSESDSALLAASANLVGDAANLRKMITDYAGGSAGSGIELAVTELNSVTSDPGKQSASLVDGLFYADAIGALASTEFNAAIWWALRNGGETGNNNSAALYGWRQYGDYGVVSSGDISAVPANTPFPSYYAAKLLTNWGRGGDRVVGATSNYALLSIYAAKLTNGSLALLVINKHPSADLNGQITLNNFTPGSATVSVVAYGKPNDSNSTDLSTGTATVSGTTISYTFPSYSMSVLLVKGQYEAWREAYFTPTELTNWSLSGDDGEPAEDGVPNLLKYALGLPPKTPATSGLPSVGSISTGGKSYLSLSFTDQAALADITYTVQVSSDLLTWQSGLAYAVRTDNGSTSTATYRDLTAIGDLPRHFLRLNITRP